MTRPQSTGTAKKGKIELEKHFLGRFDAIVKLCKDKEIKMFRCVGDPEPSEADTAAITSQRQAYLEDTLDTIRSEGVQRYQKVLDHDKPVLQPILPHHPPTWDFSKNHAAKLRKMRLRKFMNAATKIVLRARVERRLSSCS